MIIRAGYEISLLCERPVPLIGLLSVHPSREHDLVSPAIVMSSQNVGLSTFRDSFGNTCTRTLAPGGELTLTTDFTIHDEPDTAVHAARELRPDELPDDVMHYLLGSRYCETDKLSPLAWSLFGDVSAGRVRVEAIIAYVQDRISLGYEYASTTRSAWEAHQGRHGVSRDRVHLALAFCRSLNIPARYCCGYLCEVEATPPDVPVDFSSWLQVYLGDRWHTFDPAGTGRHTGRVLMACGRDAGDVAIYTTFGPSELRSFRVFASEAT